MILASFWVKLIAETLPDLASGAGPNRFPKSRRTNREKRIREQERKSRGARQRGDGVADSLVINKNQISGRIAQSQTATRFAYAVAYCALCTLRRMCSVCGEGGKGAWQPASSPIRSPACIKQRRLGSCFVGTTCFGPNSRYLHRLEAPPCPSRLLLCCIAGVLWLTLCASDCLVAVVVFRLLYCIGACRMEIENCS